jgi:hypothetical protein
MGAAMNTKTKPRFFIVALLVIFSCVGLYLTYDRGRPAPVPLKQELFEGLAYQRVVRISPRPMIAHVVMIDMRTEGIKFVITPADSESDKPLNARTTSQFLKEFGVQIAINGDAFVPWWSRSPADYYPHVGDPVAPLGLTAYKGDVYTEGEPRLEGTEPTLYISRRNEFTFTRPDKIYHALSGDRMLVKQSRVVEELNDSDLDPRTAIGINKNGRYLILIVVDGRQPFYSEGATFVELAELFLEYDAAYAMALDGGGSSTLVILGADGEPVVLNSPIDNYIPGRERPVANHFGILIDK